MAPEENVHQKYLRTECGKPVSMLGDVEMGVPGSNQNNSACRQLKIPRKH